MTKRIPAILLAIAIATAMHVLVQADIKVGPNVNIVAGIRDQVIGDMFRQRQNEPAQWVFAVNTNHRMAAYNDYRTVDLANDQQIGTPAPAQGLLARFLGLFRKPQARATAHRAVSGQAWIGLSFTDNAADWYTGLHPGSPFDATNLFPELGAGLPPGVVMDAASDPVLGGTHDHAVMAGIAFDSRTGHSRGFFSVWRDTNNAETGPNIVFVRAGVLDTTNDKFFIDKPSIAVSPSGRVVVAFVKFDESDPNKLSSKIIVFRSPDLGLTWHGPTVVSQPLTRNQSPWLLFDPNNDNTVYIGWRVFSAVTGGWTNAIVGKKTTNFGANWAPIVPYPVALLLKAFDQPQVSLDPATLGTPAAQLPIPRSNSYPSAVIDGNGSIHVVFTEWVNPSTGMPLLPTQPISQGRPRVVVTSSHNGGTIWTLRKAVDFGPASGTQFMPIIAVAGEPGPSCPGKSGPRSRIAVMYYDARETTKTSFLSNAGQFDVRVVEASACVKDSLGRLVWGPSQLVSQYTRSAAAPHNILPTAGCDPMSADRCMFKAVNRAYNNFGGGANSFTGDYNHLLSIPPYVKTPSGAWLATTASGVDKNTLPGASWQGLWADARDVVLPRNPLPTFAPTHPHFLVSLPWGNYQPPNSGVVSECFNPGSRDQNIYGAAMTPGLYAAAPVTFKSSNIPRDYPVVVENATNQQIFVRLTIQQGADGQFHAQFNTPGPGITPDTFADIAIGPFSSVTGSVIVLPASGPTPQPPVVITLAQITGIGPTGTIVPNGLQTSVTLNTAGDGDATNSETRSPFIDPEPEVTKPFGNIDPVTGTEITAEGSPYVQTPFGKNPFGKNPFGKNPFGKNPLEGDIFDATDVSFRVTNNGSHAAAFNAVANVQNDLLLKGGGYVFQVIISRISLTPDLNGCQTVESQVDNQVSNIQNPFAKNPFGKNPFGKNPFGKNPFGKNGTPDDFDDPGVTNSTFYASPNESGQGARLDAPGERKPVERMAARGPAEVAAPMVMPATYNPGASPLATPRFRPAATAPVQTGPADFRGERPRDEVVYTLRVFQVQPSCGTGPDTPACLTPAETFNADRLRNEVALTVASQRANFTDGVFDPDGGEVITVGGQPTPTRLAFIGQPTNEIAGEPISPAIRVAVQDAAGNTVTTSTASITLQLGANPGAGTLFGTLTQNAVAGVATFSSVAINNPANGYTLVANSEGLTSATSELFNILPQDVIFIQETDYVSAGRAGMRGINGGDGTGSITIEGVSGPVTRALLYWHGPTNSTDASANASVLFNGVTVIGTNIGLSQDNNWGFLNSHAYRADVTDLVTGIGTYTLANFRKLGTPPAPAVIADINGVSLLVFFNDESPFNNRNVYIFDGNDSNIPSAFDGTGWDRTMGGINVPPLGLFSGASLELHVADGQDFTPTTNNDDGAILLNNQLFQPQSDLFSGNTLVGLNVAGNGNLYDIRAFPIGSAFLTPGATNTLRLQSPVVSDALGLVVSVVIIDLSVLAEDNLVGSTARAPAMVQPEVRSSVGGGPNR